MPTVSFLLLFSYYACKYSSTFFVVLLFWVSCVFSYYARKDLTVFFVVLFLIWCPVLFIISPVLCHPAFLIVLFFIWCPVLFLTMPVKCRLAFLVVLLSCLMSCAVYYYACKMSCCLSYCAVSYVMSCVVSYFAFKTSSCLSYCAVSYLVSCAVAYNTWILVWISYIGLFLVMPVNTCLGFLLCCSLFARPHRQPSLYPWSGDEGSGPKLEQNNRHQLVPRFWG